MATVSEIRSAIAALADLRDTNGQIDSATLAALLNLNIDASGGGSTPTITYTNFRTTNLTNIKIGVTGAPTNVYSFYFDNPNTTDVYIKFYNALSANVTVGTTTPKYTLRVPANGFIFQENTGNPQLIFSTAMVVATTTGIADSNTTNPTTALYTHMEVVI